MYDVSEGYYIIGVMPQSEAVFSRDVSVYVSVFMEFVVFGMLFVLVYFLIKKLIVDNIGRVNMLLSKITNGDLDVLSMYGQTKNLHLCPTTSIPPLQP